MGSSAAAGAPGVALIAGVALGFGAGYVAARGATATRDAAVEALRRASDQLHETWGAARGAVQHKGLPAAAADLARGASGSLARMLRVSTSGSSGALEGAPPNGPVPAAPSSPFAAAASARPPLPGGPSVGTSGGTSVVADDDGATDDGALSPTASLAGSSVGLSRGSSSGGGARAGSSGEKLKMVVVVREDLLASGRWGQSKVAVMVSSCFMGLYKRCYKSRTLRGTLLAWEGQKGAKVVLRCRDEAALLALQDAARDAGIAAHCLLEVVPGGGGGDEAPSRTRAILALGPAPHSALVAAGCGALPSL